MTLHQDRSLASNTAWYWTIAHLIAWTDSKRPGILVQYIHFSHIATPCSAMQW